jgi:transposase-like protein
MKKLQKKLINAIKGMTDEQLQETSDILIKILDNGKVESNEVNSCPYCEGEIIKNGKQCGKQRYQCKSCGKTFTCTVNTVRYRSRANMKTWEDVIFDTLNHTPIDETAERLGLSHDRVFHMRHKVLASLQNMEANNPTTLSTVNECDETFVLESLKGRDMPDGYWRKARKHGAKAQKRGVSNEYVCICTAIGREGGAIATSINRAAPDSLELLAVYDGYLNEDTLVICDGLRSYGILNSIYRCPVKDANKEADKFFNLNSVNGFHSFIKQKYVQYRGVATKFINRYNALFSKTYRAGKALLDGLCNMMLNDNSQNHYFSKQTLTTLGLFAI